MSGDVPEGWSSVALGDVIRLDYGRALSASAREPGDIPVYGSNGVCGQHSTALVNERGIVVGRKGTAGSVTVTTGPFWPIDTTYFVVPRLKVDFDWLAATLEYARLSELNEATGVPGLNRDKAYLQPILLPPLDEQRRIAEVLRSVDEASRRANDVSSLEARLGDRLIGGLFTGAGGSHDVRETELGSLPSGWSVKDWGSLCSMVGVGIASSATHAYSSEGIPLIRNQNILFGSLDFTDLLRVTPEYDQQYTSKRLKAGDVITMRTGYPGRSAVVPPELGGCQTFTTLISRPKQDFVLPSYLCGWINSERGRREVLRLQAGGAQQNLNAGSLRHLLVPVPPMAEQVSIVESVESFERNRTMERSFAAVQDAIRRDLLTGRVRVPALAPVTSSKPRGVQPAFKRAVFAAEVVHQLHNDDRFGSVKHEKIVHLCELHLGLQDDLDRHAYKEAAGPYDPSARRSVERIFRQQKWFDPTKQDKRIIYLPLEASGGHARYFDRYFSDRKAEVQGIIDLLRPLTTQQCEIIATLYAVWNDFLIDGRQPSDDEIVDGVLNNWTDSKRQIPEKKWRVALPWMRQKGLIPAGGGEKTRVAST